MKSDLLTRKNILCLNILLGVVLVVSSIFLVRDALSHYFEHEKNVRKSAGRVPEASAPKPEKQLSDYAPILANNPFGFPGGEIKNLTGSAGHGSPRGDVTLIGTVAGPRELSYGIFRDAAGVQEVFKIGEPVFGIGELHRVERDKVVIRKGAATEEILLEDVKVREVKNQPSASLSTPSFARKIGRSTYMVDQARLQQAIANPGQMMTDARLKPNIVDGKEEGFVLSEVRAGGIYQSLGLQDGDVLLRINEYDISNPERALQAFTALKGMDRVQVDIMRAGSRMTMTYQIK